MKIINISHKVQLKPNNKAKSHFKKAFGCARLAYNWGLARWNEEYKKGNKVTTNKLNTEFNAIKKEQFPFVMKVSKYATQQPFRNLKYAFNNFFRDLKKGKVSYPKFKKKRENSGSFHLGGDVVKVKDEKYLQVPKLGLVKMREKLRFQGKILSVTISQKADKYYASFSMEITQEEYNRTHKKVKHNNSVVGIDLGISNFLSLSNGLQIQAPKPLDKLNRLLVKRQRQLSKKQHPKTKDDVKKGVKKSNSYLKATIKLNKVYTKITNIRKDFLHKVTSHIVRNYDYIGLEDLNVSGMVKNHKLARSLSDVSFYEFNRMLEYKAGYNNKKQMIYRADRFYPSSKTCSKCGSVKKDLKLSDRTYRCDECGYIVDRDLNAAINLHKFIEKEIGRVDTKFTPVDLTALLDDLAINQIATSKVVKQEYNINLIRFYKFVATGMI